MIEQSVLIRRALRWVVDQHDLTVAALALMDTATRGHLEALALTVADHMQYNQLRYFRPFEHQRRFFDTHAASRRHLGSQQDWQNSINLL